MCPQNPGFRLSFSRYGVFAEKKKLKTVFGTSFPTERVTLIFGI